MNVVATIENTIIRSQFEDTLKLKKILGARIEADADADTLKLAGHGFNKQGIEVWPVGVVYKLSEKRAQVDKFLAKVKKQIKYKTMHKANLDFNYETEILTTTIKYTDLLGVKRKTTLTTDLK